MRQNLGWVVKQAINEAIRKERMSPGAAIVLSEDASTHEPSVNIPVTELASHKTSGDHDGRYYTETELNNGQLDTRYYTEAELNNGQLDGRYYTETEIDTLINALPSRHTEEFDDTDTIVVNHNMGRRPITEVIGSAVSAFGAGTYGDSQYGGIGPLMVLTPDSVVHNSEDQLTITLSEAATGEVVCIG